MAKSKAIALLHSHGHHHHLGRRLLQHRIVHPQVTHAEFPRGDIHPLVGIHSLAIPCHDRRLVRELALDSIEHLLAVSSRERGEMALGCGRKLEFVGASLQSPQILAAPRVVSGPIHLRVGTVPPAILRHAQRAHGTRRSHASPPRPASPGNSLGTLRTSARWPKSWSEPSLQAIALAVHPGLRRTLARYDPIVRRIALRADAMASRRFQVILAHEVLHAAALTLAPAAALPHEHLPRTP